MRFIAPLIIFITLFFAGLFAGNAMADFFTYPLKKVRVMLVVAHGVDEARVRRLFRVETDYIESAVNVRLLPVLVVSIPEDMSGNAMVRMFKWQARTAALARQYKVGGTLVFLAPYPSSMNAIDFKWEGVLGMASGIGVLGQHNALAYVKVIGSDWFSTRIGIHEIGHLLGAPHTDGGIMQPYADGNQYAVAYSYESIEQIQEYVSHLPD